MTSTRAVSRTRSVEVLTGGVILALGVIPMLAFLLIEPDYLLGGNDEVVDAIRAEGTNVPYFTALVLHAIGLTCLAGGIAVVGRGLGRAGRPLAGGIGTAAGVAAGVAAALLVLAHAVGGSIGTSVRDEQQAAELGRYLDAVAFPVGQAAHGAMMVCLVLLAAGSAVTRVVHPAWAGVPAAMALIAFAAVQSGDGVSPLLTILFQAVLAVAFLIAGAVGVQHPIAADDARTDARPAT